MLTFNDRKYSEWGQTLPLKGDVNLKDLTPFFCCHS